MKKHKAYINEEKCDHSPFCPAKRGCPVNAITVEKKGLFGVRTMRVDTEKCTGCGKCIHFCHAGAISLG